MGKKSFIKAITFRTCALITAIMFMAGSAWIFNAYQSYKKKLASDRAGLYAESRKEIKHISDKISGCYDFVNHMQMKQLKKSLQQRVSLAVETAEEIYLKNKNKKKNEVEKLVHNFSTIQ